MSNLRLTLSPISPTQQIGLRVSLVKPGLPLIPARSHPSLEVGGLRVSLGSTFCYVSE